MKKRLSILLTTALLCTVLAVPAMAYTDSQLEAADTLNELGLFNGYGDDADGNPIYGLDDSPSRLEGLVLLVRLLGKEEEALAGSYTHPFTDVPSWGEQYVGYAYENGLTSGVSATLFDADSSMTATQYITFVLRALGYTTGTDFNYADAISYAEGLGLITAGTYSDSQSFTRGNVVELNVDALDSNTKSGGTLADALGLKIAIPSELVGTTTVNLNDYSSSLWLGTSDGGKELNLHTLGEGLILDYDGLDKLAYVSNSEVAQTLTDILYELDSNVYLSSGYQVAAINTVLVQIRDEGDEGLYIGLKSWGSNDTPSASRTMWLNTIGYRTGDWAFATAIYGMYWDYYGYIGSGEMPDSVIEKYGLTVVEHTNFMNDDGYLTVTNGTTTAKIQYDMVNMIKTVSVNIL